MSSLDRRDRSRQDQSSGTARRISAAVVGNVLEWFDWTVYASLAVFFSPHIFPAGSALGSVLDALVVFAAGFVVRPLGGIVFGALADRRGRRSALSASVVLMGAGSLLVALCPTYAQAGALAPILLTLARLAQGFSLGGEFGVSSVFLAEGTAASRRGLVSSSYYAGTAVGLLLASGATSLLLVTLGRSGVEAWGWRLAFGVGALGAVAGWLVRRGTGESEAFRASSTSDRGSLGVLRRHPRAMVRIFAFSIGPTLVFYTFASYFPTYLTLHTGASATAASLAGTGAIAVFLVLQPVFGGLADRVGHRPMLLVFAVGTALVVVPAVTLIGPTGPSAFGVDALLLALFGAYSAIAPTVMAAQLPPEVRALGVGAPYNLAVALFGGTAPALLTWAMSHGLDLVFFGYVAAACVLAAVVFAAMPDPDPAASDPAGTTDHPSPSEELAVP
jgi:MFS transporter, MHS family, alpha-ketoglutarate permease